MSSLRRGHANLLCIVPILVYVLPKWALMWSLNAQIILSLSDNLIYTFFFFFRILSNLILSVSSKVLLMTFSWRFSFYAWFLCMLSHFSHVQLCMTLWTVACQAPPLDFPGESTGVGCRSLLQGIFWPRDWTCISYVSCVVRQILYHYCHPISPYPASNSYNPCCLLQE